MPDLWSLPDRILIQTRWLSWESYMLRSSHFSFLAFGHFWRQSYKNTKILRNLCLHFARQDGQDKKTGMKITQLKWTKYQKPKDEIWDEQNKDTLDQLYIEVQFVTNKHFRDYNKSFHNIFFLRKTKGPEKVHNNILHEMINIVMTRNRT